MNDSIVSATRNKVNPTNTQKAYEFRKIKFPPESKCASQGKRQYVFDQTFE